MQSVPVLDYQPKQDVVGRWDRAAAPWVALSLWIMVGVAVFPIVLSVAYFVLMLM